MVAVRVEDDDGVPEESETAHLVNTSFKSMVSQSSCHTHSMLLGVKEDPTPDDMGRAGLVSSTANLVKSILGIGLVSQPYVCRTVGVVPFIAGTLLLATVHHFANIILAKAVDCSLRGGVTVPDFVNMGVRTLGKWSHYVVYPVYFVESWGAIIPLYIVLFDVLTPYLGDAPALQHHWVLLPIVLALIYPFCCLRTMHSLRFTSYLGIAGLAVLSSAIVGWSVHTGHSLSRLHVARAGTDLLAMVPVITFGLVGQFNIPRIYYELKDRSPGRMATVSIAASLICVVFYCVLGISGNVAFGDDVKEDVIDNFAHVSSWPIDAAKIIFGVAVFFTFPVFHYEVRCMTERMLVATFIKGDLSPRASMALTFAVTVLLLSAAMVIAAVWPDVIGVFGVLGASFATCLAWLFPPLYYIKQMPEEERHSMWHYMSLFLIGLSVICIPFFTAVVLWQKLS